MSDHNVHLDAGAYALDALPDDERAFFERHLTSCESCRREVAEYRATAAELATLVEEAPPAGLRSRVFAEVDRTAQQPPVAAPAPAVWRRRLAAVAAAVVLLATGATLGAALTASSGDGLDDDWLAEARVVELEAPEGTQARFLYAPDQDRGVLVADGLAPLDAERETYQLWVLRDGEPAPAGLFRPDASGAVVARTSAPLEGAEAVAVTVEPAGGSPAPTSEILVQGGLDG